ncbi:S-layer homology domain-containing protein [Paenibacillus daejeonensis]|uniref:S-layer homology domain-containing protein n=1 Tax=Paenibacillus daejeonensis TaxID=135193 RepID=UPI000377297A|nr:S-layer homology domain-containing protein [Paenibacillus daejeonensis]
MFKLRLAPLTGFTLSLLLLFQLALPVSLYAEPLQAPVMDETHAPAFPAIEEDSNGGAGLLVSEMIDGSITSDTGQYGIAVYGMTGYGSWEAYYNDTWWNMEPLTPQTASMLKSDVRLRFVPAADWHGTATLSYRAWDLSNDEGPTDLGRTKHDITVYGGVTAYSAGTQTASIVVTPVNDAPRPIFPLTPKLLQFDGVNSYVTVNNLALKGEMTFEAWVYAENPYAAWSRLFDFGNGSPGQNIMVGFRSSTGQMFMHNYTMDNQAGEIIVNDIFPVREWVHVEVIIDDAGMGYIYWDGVLKASGYVGLIVDTPRAINYIGRSHWGQDAYFKGKIRDVRFWDTARTEQELLDNKNNLLTGKETGLVGYMPMLEGEGSYLNDLTGREISGNIIEATWVEDADAPLSVTIMENTDTVDLLYDTYILDVDAEDTVGAQITLQLSVPLGSIHLGTATGTSIIAGANGSTSVTLRGGKTAVNQALATLRYAPPLNFFGLVTMDVHVDDEGNSGPGGALTGERQLYVTVLPSKPIATSIPNQVLKVNESTGTLPFTISGGILSPGQMIVNTSSSDETLVPIQGITLGGQDGNRTVTITPAAGQNGLTQITLTVSDGRLESYITFQVLVLAESDVEDWIDGWILDLENGDNEFIPGDALLLEAETDMLTDRVEAIIGSEAYDLILVNSLSFINDGYKYWRLQTEMPAVTHGEQYVQFNAYYGTTLRRPERNSWLNNNKFLLFTPAAGIATSIQEIQYTSAIVLSNIASSGGKPVTERGVIFSLSPNPTVDNGKIVVADEGGIESYDLLLDGLTENTVYYVRSYATNELGTAYSPIVSFRTLSRQTTTPVYIAPPASSPVKSVTLSARSQQALSAGLTLQLPLEAKVYTPQGLAISGDYKVDKDGKLVLNSLSPGEYQLVISAKNSQGELLAGQLMHLIVDSQGNATVNDELIDPFGIITDRITGNPIHGVNVTLYWSDTELNRSKGRTPDTKVNLPGLPGFAPQDNANSQISSITGEYAWMVPAFGDYYILAVADGYDLYDSRNDSREETIELDSHIRQGVIHVGTTIVPYSFEMEPTLIESGEHNAYLKGFPDGTFRPNDGLTRAQLAAILSRIIDKPTPGMSSAGYKDVLQTHWAAGDILWATQHNWLQGYGDGRFAPERKVTRAELVQALVNITQPEAGTVPGFSDTDSHWAAAAVAAASRAGWVSGYEDGTFRPNASVSRAEAVTIVNRYLQRMPLEVPAASPWSDLTEAHWAFADIMEASYVHDYRYYATSVEEWTTN